MVYVNKKKQTIPNWVISYAISDGLRPGGRKPSLGASLARVRTSNPKTISDTKISDSNMQLVELLNIFSVARKATARLQDKYMRCIFISRCSCQIEISLICHKIWIFVKKNCFDVFIKVDWEVLARANFATNIKAIVRCLLCCWFLFSYNLCKIGGECAAVAHNERMKETDWKNFWTFPAPYNKKKCCQTSQQNQ